MFAIMPPALLVHPRLALLPLPITNDMQMKAEPHPTNAPTKKGINPWGVLDEEILPGMAPIEDSASEDLGPNLDCRVFRAVLSSHEMK